MFLSEDWNRNSINQAIHPHIYKDKFPTIYWVLMKIRIKFKDIIKKEKVFVTLEQSSKTLNIDEWIMSLRLSTLMNWSWV